MEYGAQAHAAALAAAERLVSCAHTHFLPPPALGGWIVGTVSRTGAVSMTVAWQQSHAAFETWSTGPSNSNLSGGYLSALPMAASLKRAAR